MAGTAVLGRLSWLAAEAVDFGTETARVKTIAFDVPEWRGHLPGQHVDVRLTAEDGYQAERSYSIASAPGQDGVTITVERIDDGEVSPFLVGEARVGDMIELRGPIGGYFVWQADDPRPVLLIAGGSGVVPLMAMIRHRATTGSSTPIRLLFSSRAWDDVIYREELGGLAGDGLEVRHTLTRSQPDGWEGYKRRIDAEMLGEVAWPVEQRPQTFICGPTPFVEHAAEILVGLGHPEDSIRTERFGPTGG